MIAEGRAPTVLWALCQGCHVAQRSGGICSRLVKRAQKVLELLLSVGRLTDPLSFPVRQVLVQYAHCFCLLVCLCIVTGAWGGLWGTHLGQCIVADSLPLFRPL